MGRAMRHALLAAALVGVGCHAYANRRKLLAAIRKVCPPLGACCCRT